jgi:rhodanese-related sulfurtransferase
MEAHLVNAFWRTILTATVLVAVSCTLAIGVNATREAGIPLIRPAVEVTDNGEGPVISMARAKALYDAGAVFVDSRTQQEYDDGHIKGARLIYYAHVGEEWETAMAGVPFDAPIISYCSGEGCNSSYLVADYLMNVGFEQVFVFHGGWPEWSAAEYPLVGKPQSVHLYEFK